MTSTLVVEKPVVKKEVQETSVKSYWLSLGEIRLDASYYAQDVSKATRLLEESGYELVGIEQLSDEVFTLARIKRFYGDSRATPYLMPSELFYFPLSPTKYVFANKIKNVERWFLKEGWMVVTCSGRIGNPLIVTKSYEGFIVSHDVARVIPGTDTLAGFLYAYLSTWAGNALLTKDQYGVVVDHIEPHHIKTVKIPLLPKEIQKALHLNVLKVFDLREKARTLHAKARKELLEDLELPEIQKPARTEPFSVSSSDLGLRFDVSYHDRLVEDIREKLRQCKYGSEKLEKHIQEPFIPNRFKRIFVEKEYGVPFLSGANIVQIRPYDLRYLSKRVTAQLENCLVRKGWVLLTRSGTVGRVALVPSNWDGWAVTEDAIRIVPIPEKIHRGFLTAFLLTEYGHLQVLSRIYGGVVDHLAEDDVKDILVPVPSADVQEKIGELIVEAYELKELANQIEDETIKTLEYMLSVHKRTQINEEYLKEINAYADSFELIGNEKFRNSLEELESEEATSFDDS